MRPCPACAQVHLTIIVVAGLLYGRIASSLNDFENYRTEVEHQNGMILKNFIFQCPDPPARVASRVTVFARLDVIC